jgi:hypothetical protein
MAPRLRFTVPWETYEPAHAPVTTHFQRPCPPIPGGRAEADAQVGLACQPTGTPEAGFGCPYLLTRAHPHARFACEQAAPEAAGALGRDVDRERVGRRLSPARAGVIRDALRRRRRDVDRLQASVGAVDVAGARGAAGWPVWWARFLRLFRCLPARLGFGCLGSAGEPPVRFRTAGPTRRSSARNGPATWTSAAALLRRDSGWDQDAKPQITYGVASTTIAFVFVTVTSQFVH